MNLLVTMTGFIFLFLGVFWSFVSLNLGIWENSAPGSGLFPLFIGVPLAILGIIFIFNKSKSRKTLFSLREIRWFVFIPIVISFVVFSMLFLGTFISLFLFLVLWLKFLEGYSIWKSLMISIICLTVIYLVFVSWLRIPFPESEIPFLTFL